MSAPAAAAAAREPARSRVRPGSDPEGAIARRLQAASLPSPLTLRRCACGGSCPRCRGEAPGPKLAINTPGDRFEREADAAAEAVMSGAAAASASPAPPLLRRCACGGSCPSCRKEQAEQEPELRREAAGGGAPGFAPPLVHDVLASPGRPLAAPTRGFMEGRFGADFSAVRVHDDAHAAESARAVAAHAYAVGSDLVFAGGRYAPGTAAGDRLLAHELAHVVQQQGPGRLARSPCATAGAPRLRALGSLRLLQRASCTPDSSGKCCFACPKPPASPANRCCTKDKFDFVEKSEKAGDVISSKAWDRWNVVRDCLTDDARVAPLLLKHFKVNAQSPGTAVSSISGALDKIISLTGIIPDCEPHLTPGDTDQAKVSAGWRPLNHSMCIDFYPAFFEKARAARAPITTIHEKAHSLAGKDDRGGYEGDQTYPGANAATALGNADSVANFIRDLAALTPAPACKAAAPAPGQPQPQPQPAPEKPQPQGEA